VNLFSIPRANAEGTIYPAWRVLPVHWVAKLFGVLVHVGAMPFGSIRVSRRFPGCFTRGDVRAAIERARRRGASAPKQERQG